MDVLTHKCPNCGGALTFDPDDQKFHCPYCLSIFTVDEVSAFEEKQKQAQMVDETTAASDQTTETTETTETTDADDGLAESMDLFLCPSCGAEIVTDATTAATYCYYCHNPVVLQGRLSGKFLPSKVLPFSVGKKAATEKFLAWAQKKWFVPKDFFSQAQVEKLTGVYFPYWNVDAETKGEITGTGTSLRVWLVGDIEYTETKQYEIERAGTIKFKNLVKNALSKNVQQKMVSGVQPFPMDKAVAFKNQYLAGFQAEKRDIEYLEMKPAIEKELSSYSEDLLKETVGSFSTFVTKQKQVELTAEKEDYLLLPVWLVTYRSNEADKKIYYYAMNGQTGKVSGILPISYKKLGATAFGIFLIVLLLFLVGGYFI
ncbi:TFIIB-type zinc ribbon-containing protein [Enterococcus massiliensis]|uniref:TFIIB-type zinc ribbon-containing protein n=1 Tax=Enterococcus massiliensis TaxID=1640685 RepID=UPI00065E6882|nr:TFIIB-type zinc ribbon-containing protein [Enterococcus massiliensis]